MPASRTTRRGLYTGQTIFPFPHIQAKHTCALIITVHHDIRDSATRLVTADEKGERSLDE
jgi:hypothetical protein